MSDILEKIGYGRPPKKHRFKKGQSGNPGGRPKGSKSLYDTVIENLRRRMPARINGQLITTNVKDAVIKAQLKKALEGDTRAAKFMLDLNSRAEERKYYMETAADYLGKQITKALRKAAFDPEAGQEELDHVRTFAETVLKKYEADGGE